MEIVMLPITDIRPADSNPRNIDDHAIDSLANSIQLYGFQQPIVVDPNMVIIVGHTRYLAAWRLGLDRVPVKVNADWDEHTSRGYRITDNRSHENTDWNTALLLDNFAAQAGQLLEDLDTTGLEVLAHETGFAVAELEQFTQPLDDLEPMPAGVDDTWWVTLSVPSERRDELEAAVERLAKRVGAEILRR